MHFEWGAAKAASNRRKQGVGFELAATVFRDPLMISIPDEDHSGTEERWITMGQAENSTLLLVVHTRTGVLSRPGTPRTVGRRLCSLFAAWFPGGAT
ncbi:BrnT family toxin [Thiorhodococcus mannitoliphagus]|uniref:BrnT family toxin n=1 Tax=Thiorhodococcus mannitoliphagus TaxID=329406 RepID=A0A6P1E4A9_9GAMM|nr:BrnT family toxin [Thiorhodococcus mannitoliphagus]